MTYANDVIIEMAQIAAKNLSEPGAQFILGAGAEYSLADAIATHVFTRMQLNPSLFKEQVSSLPVLNDYFERLKAR